MHTQDQRETGAVTRRSYLGMVGAAVAGATSATTATAASGAAYETVTVDADTRKIVTVDDGETLENKLYDVTANGAGLSIVAIGTEWTIRNVAVRGQVEMGDESVFAVGDTGGGTSRIENVWLGDGDRYGETGATGVWVTPDHDGHLEITGVNVQNMSDNAFYCSAPGLDRGEGGTVALTDCYAANCYVALYRLSEGSLENCVAAVSADAREYRTGRGVWAWAPGPVEVDGCDFAMNGTHYSFRAGAENGPTEITVENTEWDDGFNGGYYAEADSEITFAKGNGRDPEDRVPDGCPESVIDVFDAEVGQVLVTGQETDGETVVVSRAAYDSGANDTAEFAVTLENRHGEVVGESGSISSGAVRTDIEISLDSALDRSQAITATLREADGGTVGDPITIHGERIDDTAIVRVGGEDPVDRYRNEDGNVETAELRDAVADWRADEISTYLLREVVGHWRTDSAAND